MDRRGVAVGTAAQGCEGEALQTSCRAQRLCFWRKQSAVEQRKVGRWSEANTQPPVASRSKRSEACSTQRKRLHDNARPDCRLHQPRSLSPGRFSKEDKIQECFEKT